MTYYGIKCDFILYFYALYLKVNVWYPHFRHSINGEVWFITHCALAASRPSGLQLQWKYRIISAICLQWQSVFLFVKTSILEQSIYGKYWIFQRGASLHQFFFFLSFVSHSFQFVISMFIVLIQSSLQVGDEWNVNVVFVLAKADLTLVIMIRNIC